MRRSLLCLLPLLAATAHAAPRSTVEIQFLTVSDWHAQLDPLSITGVGNVGGAAVLAAYFDADRAANPNTITLAAGDSFGASPPLSGFFDEEPAVLAMNAMGFDADTLGNHNFDRGLDHLQAMIDLAEFPYLSSNLKNVDDNLDGVARYTVIEVGGVKVGIIGVTNPEVETLVKPGSTGTIEFDAAVKSANQARARAQADGAEVTVAIVHMGVTGYDDDGNAVGPLIDFADEVGNFDVIFGDHTDVKYQGVHNGALVVENASKGATYARTTLVVDPKNGRVDSAETEFVTPLASAVTPDAAITAMLAPYRAELAELFDEKIAVATGVFPRGSNLERLREAAIGDLVCEAMRDTYGTQLCLTNGGGLRAALPSSYAPLDTTLRRNRAGYAAGPPYDLVVGDVYTVLPFGNEVVTMEITGADLWSAMEHSVSALPSANGWFAQIAGFRFTYDVSQPVGARVVSVSLDDGTAIDPDETTYTLATNDFVYAGGDSYDMLDNGTGVSRDLMANVVLDYLRDVGTITPTTDGRISAVTP